MKCLQSCGQPRNRKKANCSIMYWPYALFGHCRWDKVCTHCFDFNINGVHNLGAKVNITYVDPKSQSPEWARNGECEKKYKYVSK